MINKIVAFIVLTAFCFTTLSTPYAQASIWAERRKAVRNFTQIASASASASLMPGQLQNDVSRLADMLSKDQSAAVRSQVQDALKKRGRNSFPGARNSHVPAPFWERVAGYGSIERVYLAKGANLDVANGKISSTQPLVIHIQDVHDVLGVQKNLAFLLNELTEMGVNLVGLEGSEGKLEGLEKWRQYPDRESLLEAAGYLLKNGLLTGSEIAGLARSRDSIEFYGLEDKDNYLTQVNAYKSVLAKNKQAGEWTGSAEAILKDLKSKAYSPSLKELDSVQGRYESGKIKIGEWISFLSKTHGPSQKFPNIGAFLKLYEVEKDLDLGKISREQKKILQELSSRLDKNQLVALLQDCLLFRLGRISYSEFYASLKGQCRSAEIPVSSELSKYIEYVAGTEGISQDALIKETSLLESETWNKALNKEPVAAGLHQTDSDFRLLKKGLAFNLTPADFEEFSKREAAISQLAESIGASRLDADVLNNITLFNRQSHVRSRAFVKRISAKMGEKDLKVSVLVAGGAHTEGLENLFKEKGISFITLRPKMNLAEIKQDYHPLNAFSRDLIPLEKLFAPEKVSIVHAQALGSAQKYGFDTAAFTVENTLAVLSQALSKFKTGAAKVSGRFFKVRADIEGKTYRTAFPADNDPAARRELLENPGGVLDVEPGTVVAGEAANPFSSGESIPFAIARAPSNPILETFHSAVSYARKAVSSLNGFIRSSFTPRQAVRVTGFLLAALLIPNLDWTATLGSSGNISPWLPYFPAAVVSGIGIVAFGRAGSGDAKPVIVVANPKNLLPVKRMIEQARENGKIRVVAVVGVSPETFAAQLVESGFSKLKRPQITINEDSVEVEGFGRIWVQEGMDMFPGIEADALWVSDSKIKPKTYQKLAETLRTANVVIGSQEGYKIARERVSGLLVNGLGLNAARGADGAPADQDYAAQAHFDGLQTKPLEAIGAMLLEKDGRYIVPVPQGGAGAYRLLVAESITAADVAARIKYRLDSDPALSDVLGVDITQDGYEMGSNVHKGSPKATIFDIQANPVNGGGTQLSVSYFYDGDYVQAEDVIAFLNGERAPPAPKAAAQAPVQDPRKEVDARYDLMDRGRDLKSESILATVDKASVDKTWNVAVNAVKGRIGFLAFMGLLKGGKLPGSVVDERNLNDVEKLSIRAVNGGSLSELVGHADSTYPWLKFGGKGSGIQVRVRNARGDEQRLDTLTQDERDRLLADGYGQVKSGEGYRIEKADVYVTVERKDTDGKVIQQRTMKREIYFFSGKKFYSDVPQWGGDIEGLGVDLDTDLLIEASGQFTNYTGSEIHRKAGAKRVLITAPYKDDKKGSDHASGIGKPGKPKKPLDIVMGANHPGYSPDMNIFTNASCTTNGMTGVMALLDRLKILGLIMTTIHAATNSQNLKDAGPEKDLALWGLISTSTGFSKAVKAVFPMMGKFVSGTSMRVPIKTVSVNDVVAVVEKKISRDEFIRLLKDAGGTFTEGIVGVTDFKSTSQMQGNTLSGIVQLDSIAVKNVFNPAKNAWQTQISFRIYYDNEYGYSQRVLDLAAYARAATPVDPDKIVAGKPVTGDEIVESGTLDPRGASGAYQGRIEMRSLRGMLLPRPINLSRITANGGPAVKAYLRHLALSILDEYFIASGRYAASHIPAPFGWNGRGYLYAYADVHDRFSWLNMHGDPVNLPEWDSFTDAFRATGADLARDIIQSDDRRISQNIIRQSPDRAHWQRINFESSSILYDSQKLEAFAVQNQGLITRALGEQKYRLLLLSLREAADAKAGSSGELSNDELTGLIVSHQNDLVKAHVYGKEAGPAASLRMSVIPRQTLERWLGAEWTEYYEKHFAPLESYVVALAFTIPNSMFPGSVVLPALLGLIATFGWFLTHPKEKILDFRNNPIAPIMMIVLNLLGVAGAYGLQQYTLQDPFISFLGYGLAHHLGHWLWNANVRSILRLNMAPRSGDPLADERQLLMAARFGDLKEKITGRLSSGRIQDKRTENILAGMLLALQQDDAKTRETLRTVLKGDVSIAPEPVLLLESISVNKITLTRDDESFLKTLGGLLDLFGRKKAQDDINEGYGLVTAAKATKEERIGRVVTEADLKPGTNVFVIKNADRENPEVASAVSSMVQKMVRLASEKSKFVAATTSREDWNSFLNRLDDSQRKLLQNVSLLIKPQQDGLKAEKVSVDFIYDSLGSGITIWTPSFDWLEESWRARVTIILLGKDGLMRQVHTLNDIVEAVKASAVVNISQ